MSNTEKKQVFISEEVAEKILCQKIKGLSVERTKEVTKFINDLNRQSRGKATNNHYSGVPVPVEVALGIITDAIKNLPIERYGEIGKFINNLYCQNGGAICHGGRGILKTTKEITAL